MGYVLVKVVLTATTTTTTTRTATEVGGGGGGVAGGDGREYVRAYQTCLVLISTANPLC